MTGKHEFADFDAFSYGVTNRRRSVRIGRGTEKDGCGYFEDRRRENADLYIVSEKLWKLL